MVRMQIGRKKLIPILLICTISLASWYFLLLKIQTKKIALNPSNIVMPTESNPLLPKTTVENNDVIVTYVPNKHKNPFKPLIAKVEDNSQVNGIPTPEGVSNPPLPEPIVPESNNPLPENVSPVNSLPSEQVKEENKQPPILKGIMGDSNGFSALIELNGNSYLVNQGDKVTNEWRVLSINRNQVVLHKNQEKLILEIGKDGSGE